MGWFTQFFDFYVGLDLDVVVLPVSEVFVLGSILIDKVVLRAI